MRVWCVAILVGCCMLLSACAGAPDGRDGQVAPPPTVGHEPANAAPASANPSAPLPAPANQPVPAAGPGGITAEEAQHLPPLAPAGVGVERADGSVAVVWRGTDSPVARYELYRKSGESDSWQLVGSLPSRSPDAGQYRWVDPAPVAGARYGVKAVSPHGLRSEMTVS